MKIEIVDIHSHSNQLIRLKSLNTSKKLGSQEGGLLIKAGCHNLLNALEI